MFFLFQIKEITDQSNFSFSKAPACSCHGTASHFSHLTVLCLSHPLETPCPFSCFAEAADGGCAQPVWPVMCLLWHLLCELVERQGHNTTWSTDLVFRFRSSIHRSSDLVFRILLPPSFPNLLRRDPCNYLCCREYSLYFHPANWPCRDFSDI